MTTGRAAWGSAMSFRSDNKAYERWLATQCDVVKKDIVYKHKRMKKSPFIFLRATYFRWARKIGDWCPELMDAPQLLSIGDLHLENFGTWRDADGRLVWGVNDFDEAAVMPYVLDLVRLATSIRLAPNPAVDPRHAANAVLRGYREGLENPQPALLFGGQTWLRRYAEPAKGKPEKFWEEVHDYEKYAPPPRIAKALIDSLPKDTAKKRLCRLLHKGGGSLGRPRYVAVGYWRGGHVLREAKALVPSAWTYANGGKSGKSNFLELANGQYRAPDPFLDVRHHFVFRRISADSQKIELGDSAGKNLHLKLLEAMGFDVASVHAAGSVPVKTLKADLDKRPRGWLNAAAEVAADKVKRDFREWRN